MGIAQPKAGVGLRRTSRTKRHTFCLGLRILRFFKSSRWFGGSSYRPSSNPKRIYDQLHEDCRIEDGRSALIRGYKKTFRRLARGWNADGSLSDDHCAEIIARLESPSWQIWRPVLYVIPKAAIAAHRIEEVRRRDRAGYGPELQITDLQADEFDVIEL